MPLTDELGSKAIERARVLHPDIGIPQVSFSPQYSFESLLSLLAKDQPHLTDPRTGPGSRPLSATAGTAC